MKTIENDEDEEQLTSSVVLGVCDSAKKSQIKLKIGTHERKQPQAGIKV